MTIKSRAQRWVEARRKEAESSEHRLPTLLRVGRAHFHRGVKLRLAQEAIDKALGQKAGEIAAGEGGVKEIATIYPAMPADLVQALEEAARRTGRSYEAMMAEIADALLNAATTDDQHYDPVN